MNVWEMEVVKMEVKTVLHKIQRFQQLSDGRTKRSFTVKIEQGLRQLLITH